MALTDAMLNFLQDIKIKIEIKLLLKLRLNFYARHWGTFSLSKSFRIYTQGQGS
jgi:hypothetical protein